MYSFSKEDTKLLKGVAIVLMLSHHLFSYASRVGEKMYPVSLTKFEDIDTAKYIGDFGQICVAAFLFLAGYGIFKSYKENQFYIAKKIYAIYKSMWKVMAIFVPIGYLWCSNQAAYCSEPKIYNAFSEEFKFSNLVSNMLGITFEYNQEWWFIRAYIVAIISFPLVVRLIKKNDIWKNLWLLLAYTVALNYVIPEICQMTVFSKVNDSILYSRFIAQNNNMSSFWMGCILAKDNVFEKCIKRYEELRLNNIVKDCIGLFMITVCRNMLVGDELDFIYVPILFIICRDLLSRTRILKSCFHVIGEKSMNIWLIHSYFCYYFYPMVVIVFWPRYAFLILPWLVIICLVVTKAMEFFYSMLERVIAWIERAGVKVRSQAE